MYHTSFFLMSRLPPKLPLTDTLFPDTTLFRSSQRLSPRITDRTNKGAELIRSGAYYNPSNLLVSLSIRPLGSALTVDQACLGPAKRGNPLIAQASDGVRPGRDTPNRM